MSEAAVEGAIAACTTLTPQECRHFLENGCELCSLFAALAPPARLRSAWALCPAPLCGFRCSGSVINELIHQSKINTQPWRP